MNNLSQWLRFHAMLYVPFCLVPFLVGPINALTTTKINFLPNGQVGGYELLINNTDYELNRLKYGSPSHVNGEPSILSSPKNTLPYPPPGKLNENAISYKTYRKNQPVHNYESSFTRVDQRKVGEDVLVSIHNVLTKKTHREPKYPVSSLLMIPSLHYKNGVAEPINLKLAQIGPYAALLVPVENQASPVIEYPVVPDLSKTIKSFVEVKNYQPPTRRNTSKYSYPYLYSNSGRYPPSSSEIDRSDIPPKYLSGSTQLSQSNFRYKEGIFGKVNSNSGLPVDLSKDFAIRLTDLGANIYNPSRVQNVVLPEKSRYEEHGIVSQESKTVAKEFQPHTQASDPGSINPGNPLGPINEFTKKHERPEEILQIGKNFNRPSSFEATESGIDVRLGKGINTNSNDKLGSSVEPNKKYFDHSNPQLQPLQHRELSSGLLNTFPTETSLESSKTENQQDPSLKINPETTVGGLTGIVEHPTAGTPLTGNLENPGLSGIVDHPTAVTPLTGNPTPVPSHNAPESTMEFSVFGDDSQQFTRGSHLALEPIDHVHSNPESSVFGIHLPSNGRDWKYFDHSRPLPEVRSSFLGPDPPMIHSPAGIQVEKELAFHQNSQLNQQEISEEHMPESDRLRFDDGVNVKQLAGSGIVQLQIFRTNFPDNPPNDTSPKLEEHIPGRIQAGAPEFQAGPPGFLAGSPSQQNFHDSLVGLHQYGDHSQKSAYDDGTGHAKIQEASHPKIGSDRKYFDHSNPAYVNGQSSSQNLEPSNLSPGKFSTKLFPEGPQIEGFARDVSPFAAEKLISSNSRETALAGIDFSTEQIENASVAEGIAQTFEASSPTTTPKASGTTSKAFEATFTPNFDPNFSSDGFFEHDQRKYFVDGKKLSLEQSNLDQSYKDTGSLAGGTLYSTEPNIPFTQEKSDEMAFPSLPPGRMDVAKKFIISVPSLPEKADVLTDDPRFSSFSRQEKIENPGTPPRLEQKQHSPGPHIGSLLESLDGILAIM